MARDRHCAARTWRRNGRGGSFPPAFHTGVWSVGDRSFLARRLLPEQPLEPLASRGLRRRLAPSAPEQLVEPLAGLVLMTAGGGGPGLPAQLKVLAEVATVPILEGIRLGLAAGII